MEAFYWMDAAGSTSGRLRSGRQPSVSHFRSSAFRLLRAHAIDVAKPASGTPGSQTTCPSGFADHSSSGQAPEGLSPEAIAMRSLVNQATWRFQPAVQERRDGAGPCTQWPADPGTVVHLQQDPCDPASSALQLTDSQVFRFEPTGPSSCSLELTVSKFLEDRRVPWVPWHGGCS